MSWCAAKAADVVRYDFEPTDVTFIQSAMAPIMDSTRDIAPGVYERYLTYFLDGIEATTGNSRRRLR